MRFAPKSRGRSRYPGFWSAEIPLASVDSADLDHASGWA